jgi:prevent-host-death family protein
MNIQLSQQISATYVRNNFKEVNEKVIREGFCVIVRKSKPVTVLLSIKEYEKLKNFTIEKPRVKLSKSELEKKSIFNKHIGFLKKDYPNTNSVELQHNWIKYVD